MKRFWLVLAGTVLGAFAAGNAHADTYTVETMVVDDANLCTCQSDSFDQTLGTLTDVSDTFTGTYSIDLTIVRGGIYYSGTTIFGSSPSGYFSEVVYPTITITSLHPATDPFSSPFLYNLSGAVSITQANASIVVEACVEYTQQFGCSYVAGSFTGELDETYTYTPTVTAAVPEPTTIAILGSGLFGIGMIRRRS